MDKESFWRGEVNMTNKYLIQVTETIQHSWVVEAESKEDAIDIVENGLSNGDIMVDPIEDISEKEVGISSYAKLDGTIDDADARYYDKYSQK